MNRKDIYIPKLLRDKSWEDIVTFVMGVAICIPATLFYALSLGLDELPRRTMAWARYLFLLSAYALATNDLNSHLIREKAMKRFNAQNKAIRKTLAPENMLARGSSHS